MTPNRFSERMNSLKSSAIRDLLHYATLPGMIYLAGGLPAPESFPVEVFRQACNTVLDEVGAQALQYGTTEGYKPLRQYLAERMRNLKGIACGSDNILLTSGSQQALEMIGKLFIDYGDIIVVESPSYLGAIQAFDLYAPRYVTVPMDEEGIILEELERILKIITPKFLYLVPTFQNPSGRTLSLERRRQLILLAEHYDLLIVEDDPYGELRYTGEPVPPIKAFDMTGRVIYLSTFSKILSPGIRLAWVVASEEFIRKLVLIKQATDLCTSTFIQYAAYAYCQSGVMEEHIEKIRAMYKVRMEAMLNALERYFPREGVSWTHPEGGMFLWVTLPEEIDVEDMLKEAVANKVAFVPGSSFYVDGRPHSTMRLNFSNATPEQIEEGIRRLAEIVQRRLKALAQTR
ncbi:MAG: PLP-dependent aminotransferase family protein [Chloroflexia bacterium]